MCFRAMWIFFFLYDYFYVSLELIFCYVPRSNRSRYLEDLTTIELFHLFLFFPFSG